MAKSVLQNKAKNTLKKRMLVAVRKKGILIGNINYIQCMTHQYV